MTSSFAFAIIPIAWLVVALAGLKLPGHIACLTALGASIVLAMLCWGSSAPEVASAALEGVLNALWPICLVIVAALFTYNLTVRTGAMETIKRMLCGVSPDRRILALLIAWGFGNFMEGVAGFGTAVAIPASMLAGIGFNPLVAVLGCLVVNAMPTAFGSVGVPTATLASVTGLDPLALSGQIALLEGALVFISPFFLVAICGGGLKAFRGAGGVTVLAAGSFIVPWLLVSTFVGPELPNIVGAACSMACIVAYAHGSKRMPDARYLLQAAENDVDPARLTPLEGLRAWAPFIAVFVLLLGSSTLCPPVHEVLGQAKTSVVVYAGENPNALTFSWVGTPGVMIIVAAVIGGRIQGARPQEMLGVFAQTLGAYWRTLVTICSVLAMAKVMGYSGMISDIALVLVAVAGPLYPLVAPVIGALGGFVTGSGTSSNVLFGALQTQIAHDLALDGAWMAAANAAGAGIGKMICPQSIAVGASATGTEGRESQIMRSAFKYFAIYLAATCLLSLVGAFLAG